MNEAARACPKGAREAAREVAREEAWRWAIGLATGAVAVGAVVVAILEMPRAVEENTRACMAAYANDLHADLAAFGQAPAWQAQYVEALTACARQGATPSDHHTLAWQAYLRFRNASRSALT